jgi:hypothetical protein
MLLNEAKHLRSGQYVYAKGRYNSDGTAMKGRVTSVKTWKTRPSEVEIHYKHGMYDTGSFNERDLADFTTKEPARKSPKKFVVSRGSAIRRKK